MNKGKRIITKTPEDILKAKKDEPGKKNKGGSVLQSINQCRRST